MVGLMFLGCAPEPGDPTSLLVRVSLDVRGVRPSIADLDTVAADPAALEDLIAGYIADDRFGDRVRGALAPIWLTRADESDIAESNYAMPDEAAFLSAMGEEPLRLLGYVAANDRPWPEIVTADYTMVNEALAPWYPTDYPAGIAGWKQARWTDHRPAAGVLATNGLWWRYPTTTGNANRGRANAISRILLCSDILARDVALDATLDLTDEEAVADAIETNPGCANCHLAMDPVGSYLWGFYVEFTTNPSDLTHYHPEREHLWETYGNGVAPAWFGTPTDGGGLAELGARIADDPRFPSCIVQQSAEALLRRSMGPDDADQLTVHREAFLAGGATLRALWSSIVASDAYRATPLTDPEGTPWKMLSADQYVSAVADVTGFVFEAEGHDAYAEDRFGLRSLAGGGRAVFGVTAPSGPTPAVLLVEQRLAEAAGAFVAAADRAGGGRLFAADDFTATAPSEDRLRALTRRILSREPDADELSALTTLWGSLYASEGTAEAAWAGVVATLLRHPDFLLY